MEVVVEVEVAQYSRNLASRFLSSSSKSPDFKSVEVEALFSAGSSASILELLMATVSSSHSVIGSFVRFSNTTQLHDRSLTSDALDAPLLPARTHRIDCSIGGDPADGGGAQGGGRGRGRHEEEFSLPD